MCSCSVVCRYSCVDSLGNARPTVIPRREARRCRVHGIVGISVRIVALGNSRSAGTYVEAHVFFVIAVSLLVLTTAEVNFIYANLHLR